MMSEANPVGYNALLPEAAVNPAAIKEDITSAEIGSLVNENNKLLAGKMSQRKASENTGAP